MTPKPFEKSYAASLAVAVLSLVPFIVISSAYSLYRQELMHDLAANETAIELIAGLATAGYAFGALVGGDLINRFRQRRLFFFCEALFILGSCLAAAASSIVMYGAGRVLQGLATGLLLVVALPPVIRRFPPARLPVTAAAINIGFFGAVTVGPLIGGVASDGHAWRWFYAGLGGVALVVLAVSALTLPHQDPPDPRMRFDFAGIALALPATALPFWGVGELTGHGFASPLFAVPLGIGLACFAALILVEYHRKEPLSPVKQMWHTFPLIGTLAAMIGGATFITLLQLGEQYLHVVGHRPPLATGLDFWPQVAGVIITATALGLLLRTRFLPLLVLAGMALLILGGGLFLLLSPTIIDRPIVLLAAALLGLGAGATVSPGLYIAAFSLPSSMVGRTFALVELVRSVADYILAPVMMQVARAASGSKIPTASGLGEAIRITLVIAAAATLGGVLLYLLGGARLPRPDVEAWLEEDRPAMPSPRLVEPLRGD